MPYADHEIDRSGYHKVWDIFIPRFLIIILFVLLFLMPFIQGETMSEMGYVNERKYHIFEYIEGRMQKPVEENYYHPSTHSYIFNKHGYKTEQEAEDAILKSELTDKQLFILKSYERNYTFVEED
jgi:hypothetical protein